MPSHRWLSAVLKQLMLNSTRAALSKDFSRIRQTRARYLPTSRSTRTWPLLSLIVDVDALSNAQSVASFSLPFPAFAGTTPLGTPYMHEMSTTTSILLARHLSVQRRAPGNA